MHVAIINIGSLLSGDWREPFIDANTVVTDGGAGVKALAVAAHKCYENFRPGGMRVHAGSLLLEPGLEPDDFAAVRGDEPAVGGAA